MYGAVKIELSFKYPIICAAPNVGIKQSETGYSLYYQAVEIPETVYTQIEQTRENAKKKLDSIKKEIDTLKIECDNKKEPVDEAYKKYDEKKKAGATEAESEKLKKEYTQTHWISYIYQIIHYTINHVLYIIPYLKIKDMTLITKSYLIGHIVSSAL